jgi:hypothetical protein
MGERYPEGFNIKAVLQTLIVNTLMRLVGTVVRIMILAAGFCLLIVSAVAVAFVFLVWLFAPVVFGGLLALGITVILSGA